MRFFPANDNGEATQSLEKGEGGDGDYFAMQIIFVCLNCYQKKRKILKLKGYFEAIIQMTDRLMAKREKTKDKQWPT